MPPATKANTLAPVCCGSGRPEPLPAKASRTIAFRAAILILRAHPATPCDDSWPPSRPPASKCARSIRPRRLRRLRAHAAEIEGWIGFSADERARIMAELPRRLAALRGSDAERVDSRA